MLFFNDNFRINTDTRKHLKYRGCPRDRKISGAITPAFQDSEGSSSGSGIFFNIQSCMQNDSKTNRAQFLHFNLARGLL